MSLATFMARSRSSVLRGLKGRGDSPGKLYPPKSLRDSDDRTLVSLRVRVMGVESADAHEVWLTVWSRNTREIEPLRQVLDSLPEWERAGTASGGEPRFRKRGTALALALAANGIATMIAREEGRRKPFTNKEYLAHVGAMWDETGALLKRTSNIGVRERQPEPEGPVLPHEVEEPEAAVVSDQADQPDQQRTDSSFGRLAVERGYVTPEQFEEAVAMQQDAMRKMGMDIPIAQILVNRRVLTEDQAHELRTAVAVESGEARLVAGYEVLAKLGQGGMGAVYRARKLDTGELVALKVLPPSLADRQMIARFQRESEVVKQLDHDNIVGCIEFGYDRRRKCYFCALELIEGEDLQNRLSRTGVMSEDEAVSIAYQIAMALQHAFYNHLVHRDVKPENVMVTADGTAKLLDLGLARPASTEVTRLTRSGVFVGSPYYASPEQAQGVKDVDIRADIYSLGATLYHMVTGAPPFEGTSVLQVLQKHISEELPWPADINPDISDGLCLIVSKMMAKDPADRYQRPLDLLADLDALIEGTGPDMAAFVPRKSSIAAAVKPRPQAAPAPPPERLKRSREWRVRARARAESPRGDRGRRRGAAGEPAARRKRTHHGSEMPGWAKLAIPGFAVILLLIGLVMLLRGCD